MVGSRYMCSTIVEIDVMLQCQPNLGTMLRHVPTLHKGMLAWCWDKIPLIPQAFPNLSLFCTSSILINTMCNRWTEISQVMICFWGECCAVFYFGERVKLILSFFPRDNLYREFRSVKLSPNPEWGWGNIQKSWAVREDRVTISDYLDIPLSTMLPSLTFLFGSWSMLQLLF